MTKDIKTIVVGAGGRMGAALIREIAATDGVTLFGATEREGHDFVGRDAGEIAGLDAPLGVQVTSDPLPLFAEADAVIDFTVPAATLAHAELSAQARIVHVIGTTGFAPEDEAKIEAAARHAIIVKAGNMSLGVNVLTALTRRLAKLLNDDFDIEIVEMHHRHKVDAPSGTALMLGEAAAEGRGVSLAQMADRGRDGITGERERGRIGLSALRGGNVVGEHTVMFAADNERIELSHIAGDRSIFARGAVAAVKWGVGIGGTGKEKEARQKPGLYSMLDVLGLDD